MSPNIKPINFQSQHKCFHWWVCFSSSFSTQKVKLMKLFFYFSDFTTILHLGLHSDLSWTRLCRGVHGHEVFGHPDRWNRASGRGHFYLAFHRFCWKPCSRFHSTNICGRCMGRGHPPSGNFLFLKYVVKVIFTKMINGFWILW